MDVRVRLVTDYWRYFNAREFDEVRKILHPDFKAVWETTRERFGSADEFVEVNKFYPGIWVADLERLELFEDGAVSVVYVHSAEHKESFYTTSFFTFKEHQIHSIHEFWANCEEAPMWRKCNVEEEK